MQLGLRPLRDVGGVNNFRPGDSWQVEEGDAVSLFMQLVDESLDRGIEGYTPSGRRYMPAAGATLQITFANLDDARVVVRSAVQPFPLDPSIWRVDILTTDKISGSPTLRIKLTEGGVVTNGSARGMLLVGDTCECG